MHNNQANRQQETILIRAERPIYGGYTIGRLTEKQLTKLFVKSTAKTVLIRGAIPGELVEIEIIKAKKDYLLANVKNVLEPSIDRVKPNPLCIGCHLDYINYQRQLSIKEEVLLDLLERIGGIKAKLDKSIYLEDNIWNYRFRAQLKVGSRKIGFFKEKTHEIVDIEYSPLLIDELNGILKKLHDLICQKPELFAGFYEIHLSYGGWPILLVKTKQQKQGLKRSKEFNKHFGDAASALLSLGTQGVTFEIHPGKKLDYLKFGKEYIVLSLGEITYTVSPTSFFQANWRLNQVMVDYIKEALQPLDGKRVLDLYAGAGNFALPIAIEAKEVIAVEENQSAIKDGYRNLELNNIRNIKFLNIPSERFDFDHANQFDVIILDPPRSGLSPKLIDKLLWVKPAQIVYISCNPSTLARDLKIFSSKYKVDSTRLVDLFPQTYHIESLTFLKVKQ